MSGTLPPEGFLLTSLRSLNFQQNELIGIRPTEIASMTKLEYLFALRPIISPETHSNAGRKAIKSNRNCNATKQAHWNTSIPARFDNKPIILFCFLADDNILSGLIPDEYQTLTNMRIFDLWGNTSLEPSPPGLRSLIPTI